MRPRLTRMTAGLAAGTTVAVVAACAAGAYLYSIRHFKTLLDNAQDSALAQADLVRAALEHEMLSRDRTLIARMIQSFGSEPHVSGVMLLDRTGVVRYSSGLVTPGTALSPQAPPCLACHQVAPAQRPPSRVIETATGTLLRTVVPIRNRTDCHRCHDPAQKVNGIVIFDTDASQIRAAANHDLRWMFGVTAGLALLLVAAIALVLRIVVLRRLQRFETTARLIAEGDLERRVPAAGSDTISWLAREFNTMADAVTGLLGQVRSQRERLETVINSIDDGIVVLDAGRNVIAANDAFLQRTGHDRKDLLGCSCHDQPSAMCTAVDCPTLACLDSGLSQVRVCQRRTPDGSVAWEEIHASRVADAGDDEVQVVEVWRDITERRAAEARQAESHRLASLGLLASGFSHELNTPLATVLTCVEGIAREVRHGEESSDLGRVAQHAATARDQLLRCRGITQHFLRLSRGQRTSGDVVNLGESVAAVVSLIQPTARSRGVTIALQPSQQSLHVRTDEADLQHALMNVLLNALQASPQGAAVSVEMSGGPTAVVRIADRGPGIAPEQQRRIFEPFFSLREGGTGLGLFISLNSVRRWGGDIAVRSAPGEGSTFEVILPALDDGAVAGVA